MTQAAPQENKQDQGVQKGKELGPVATVQKLLTDNKAQIQMALPKHLTIDRLIRMSLTAIQKNPKLLECHPSTLGGAVMMCAIWGVEPIGPGGAWLVPFKNTKKNRMEVQFIIDYRGLAGIARNSGDVTKVEWHEVHEKDTFKYQYGSKPLLEHIPYQGAGSAGPVTHVYAIGFFKDGVTEPQFLVLTKEQALEAKKRSKAATSGPWVTDEVPMMLKTAVRRLCNQLPLAPEKKELIAREGLADIDIPQDLGTLIDPNETLTPPDENEETLRNTPSPKSKDPKDNPETVPGAPADAKAVTDQFREAVFLVKKVSMTEAVIDEKKVPVWNIYPDADGAPKYITPHEAIGTTAKKAMTEKVKLKVKYEETKAGLLVELASLEPKAE